MFFEWLGVFLGLTPETAAQVFISFLGTTVAVIATVAAWHGVKIAKLASFEAKAARFEQNRPVLDLVIESGECTARWGEAEGFGVYPGRLYGKLPPTSGLNLLGNNVGNGPAIGVSYHVEYPPDFDHSIFNHAGIGSLFERGGFKVGASEDSLDLFYSSGMHAANKIDFKSIGAGSLKSCSPGEAIEINIGNMFSSQIEKFALACLRREIEEEGEIGSFLLSQEFLVELRFSSVIGEEHFIPLCISVSRGLIHYVQDDGFHFGPPSSNWSTLEVSLNVHIKRLSKLRTWWGFREVASKTYFGKYKSA